MTVYCITSDRVFSGQIRCDHCWDLRATHIELSSSLTHDPDEHLVLCMVCAYLAGLWSCEHLKPVPVSAPGTRDLLTPAFNPARLQKQPRSHCARQTRCARCK